MNHKKLQTSENGIMPLSHQQSKHLRWTHNIFQQHSECSHQENAMETLPEDLITHIISYFHSDKPNEKDVAHVFNTLALVSKFFHEICHVYIHQTPIYYWGGRGAEMKYFHMMAWMCRHKVKVKLFDRAVFDTDLDVALLAQVLSSCDISCMVELYLEFRVLPFANFDSALRKTSQVQKSKAMEAGLSPNILKLCEEIHSVKDAQALILTLLKGRAPSLSSLMVRTALEDFNWGFLSAFSQQLLHLELDVFNNQCTYKDDEIQNISDSIERLPHLKHFSCYGPIDVSVRSKSLEVIKAFDGFNLLESNCPSLREMRLDIDLDNNSDTYLLAGFHLGIEKLTLNIDDGNMGLGDEVVLRNYRRLYRAIERISSLVEIEVCNTCIPIQIKSSSLEILKVSKCEYGPHPLITECICPSLKTIQCRDDHLEPLDTNFYAALRNKSRRLTVGDFGFKGLQVPSSCAIHLCPQELNT